LPEFVIGGNVANQNFTLPMQNQIMPTNQFNPLPYQNVEGGQPMPNYNQYNAQNNNNLGNDYPMMQANPVQDPISQKQPAKNMDQNYNPIS